MYQIYIVHTLLTLSFRYVFLYIFKNNKFKKINIKSKPSIVQTHNMYNNFETKKYLIIEYQSYYI